MVSFFHFPFPPHFSSYFFSSPFPCPFLSFPFPAPTLCICTKNFGKKKTTTPHLPPPPTFPFPLFFPSSPSSLTFSSFLPYFCSGNGKTHYIQQQLTHSPASLTVAINEAFTPLNAISKLRTLPLNQNNCAVFFNFTVLSPGVREDGGRGYESILYS